MHLRKISSVPQVALESLSFSNVRLSTVETAELKQQRRGQREGFLKMQFATCTSPIIHLVSPPKVCITFDFHFSWLLKPSQEKLKTMVMQNFGGQLRCILGDVYVANGTTTVHKNCRSLFLYVYRYGPKENFAKICQIK